MKHTFPVVTRWQMFLNYLNEYGENYAQVLCTDTRDVIFQGDAFEYFADEKKYLAYATQPATVFETLKTGELPQYEWITNFFDKDTADRLGDKKIVCSGTTIGTIPEMKIFCEKLIQYAPKINKPGVDEATEHLLIYDDLLHIENLIEMDCYTGNVLTSHWFHRLNPVIVEENFVLRGDGKIPSVVHAYDRQNSLLVLADKMYREKIFEANLQFADVKSLFEQMLHLTDSEQYSEALQLAITLIDNPKFDSEQFVCCNFHGYFGYITAAWKNIIIKNPTQTPTLELLELTLQHILLAIFTKVVKEFLISYFEQVVTVTLNALPAGRTVSGNFKIFLVNQLFNLANRFFQEKNFNKCSQYVEWIEHFQIPLSNNFYQLKAQVFVQLGRKKEAKQLMKKVFST